MSITDPIFDGISSKQWKQKIQYELNGAPYNSLINSGIQQIPIRPFYHFDDKIKRYNISLQNKKSALASPIFVADHKKTVERIIEENTNGVTTFILSFTDEKDIIPVINKLPLNQICLYITTNVPIFNTSQELKKTFPKASLFFLCDPIHQLSYTGNWKTNMNADLLTISPTQINKNNFSNISINTTLTQNAGATIIQQLAFALGQLTEYLNLNNHIDKTIYFQVAIGNNYFFEIAKLKALRLLFKTIANEFSIPTECQIIASPSKRNKTWIDSNNNTIRTATEYLSALLGGADTICYQAADFLHKKSSKISNRLAKNQLLILQKEFITGQINDPTNGCYYIDYLTHQLALKSLNLYKEIEKKGGYLKLLKEGNIQKRINDSANHEQKLFDEDKITCIGVNSFINTQSIEKIIKPELYPFSKKTVRKTIIKPIIEQRLAEKKEKQLTNWKN